MRRGTRAFALLFLLTACTGGTASTSTVATSPSTTTTTPTTTTTSSTTTTQATTTTQEAEDAFLEEPSEGDREAYALQGIITLNNTAFTPDDLGMQAFLEMLIYGAQSACIELSISGSLQDAIRGSLNSSPVGSRSPDQWTSEETVSALSTALHIVGSGTPLYCPSLTPDLKSDTTRGTEEFINAWQEFLGG